MNSAFIGEEHGNRIYEVEEKSLASRFTPSYSLQPLHWLNSTVIDWKKKFHEKEKKTGKLKSQLEGIKMQKKIKSDSLIPYSQVKGNEKSVKILHRTTK